MLMTTAISFLFLLLLSAFFSSSETAYFNLRKHRGNFSNQVRDIINEPEKLLITILTGNTFVNIALGSLAAIVTHHYFGDSSSAILFEVLIVSVVILIFGEIFPKIIALHNSENLAELFRLPVKILLFLFTPFVYVSKIITKIPNLLRMNKEKIFDSEEELKILTEIGEKEGTLQEEESEIIQSIFDFKDKHVREIMKPRVDMVAIESDSSIDDVMDLISNKQFSKIPVYKENIDKIVGIIYAKDLLPYLMGSRPNIAIVKLARNPFFVPETKEINDLMEDFKNKKMNIAIAVDEWGGTSGLITLEDIVEEVLGEIQDPYDTDQSLIFKQKDGSMIIDAKITIYDLEEEIEIEFPEDREYDTLAGFILHAAGNIPKVEDQINHDQYKMVVKSIDGNRIDKIHLIKS
ncbi:MAG: hemolysin [Candidatus Marinimicrobia bacterium]|nr:hemolysin [Candidatus Neomarinimicrobiota bacterium]|tara:strand:- start:5167 stop:6384 length:1218 start_codon:yes stop_codon:yes gene_type:complete